MRGSDLMVKCLEAEGVSRIFGLPGEENLDFMDSLIDSDIQFILTKHEASAAFMAEFAGRLIGKSGVCLSTLGPGATNLVTGIADAYLNHFPVVALTGQVRQERAYEPQKQYVDLVNLFKPITKESFSIRASSRIPSLIRKAFDISQAERPGPVHVEIPEDIAQGTAEGVPLRPARLERLGHNLESLQSVREILRNSRLPLVLAGPGIIRSGSEEAFRNFVHAWNLPVAHTWLASGLIPYDDPLSLNTAGHRKADFIKEVYHLADTVILIGYDVIEFLPMFWNLGRKKSIIYISLIPAQVSPEFNPDLQLVGSMKMILSQLCKEAEKKENWVEEIRRKLHSLIEDEVSDSCPIKPQLIVKGIREVLGREDIVVCDVGANLLWMTKFYPVFKENTLLVSNGLVPMGVAVPAAIATKLTLPNRKVVAVAGDGGFLMTSSELETARRENAPFVSVIFNDQAYGLIKLKQERTFGRSMGVDFGNPDFVRYAESFGAKGYRAGCAEDFKQILSRCIENEELAIIDVPIDYRENSRLTVS